MRTVPLLIATVLSLPTGTPAREDALVAKLAAGRETVRVVCFGDSITGVYYHTGSQRAWTDLLGLALKKNWTEARLEMINAGISGHTTAQGLARIDRDVLAKRPDLVVVMFGMNDVAKSSLPDYRDNLAEIVDRCRAAGAAVILCTPNSVTENPDRPNARLAEFSEAVRALARARNLPLADTFAEWERQRLDDPAGWSLWMSETIHPNLNGHRRFAELVAGALAGTEVTLTKEEAPPAPNPLATTLARLRAGQLVKIAAMPPHDTILPNLLRQKYPGASIEVLTWPVTDGPEDSDDPWGDGGRAAAKTFARQIRTLGAHLVVVAPPVSASLRSTDEAFLADVQWLLNLSFPFATRQWDVVAMMPDVAEAGAEFAPPRLDWWRRMIEGKDLVPIERPAGDESPAEEIISSQLFPRE